MQAPTCNSVESAIEDTKRKLNDVLVDDPLTVQIVSMKNEQMRLKKEKQELRKRLKNAEAKRSRLKKKARQLTDEDLVHVMMWRKEAKQQKFAGDGEPTRGMEPVSPDVDSAGERASTPRST